MAIITQGETMVDLPNSQITERLATGVPGLPMLSLGLVLLLAGTDALITSSGAGVASSPTRVVGVLLVIVDGFVLAGLPAVALG